MERQSIVLIVDDEPAGQETLEALLISQGYQLAFASNGAETLAQAERLTPDVILLDVMMPDMDGFEVCRRLRANPNLSEVPIIMVTALDDQDSRLAGFKAGADDFLSKPVDWIELRARIQTTVRLNRYRRLQMERAKFEWVVSNADEGYLVINDQGKVMYANQQAYLYLGLETDIDNPIGEMFLTLACKQYTPHPQESWNGWPVEVDEPQIQRYLVRPETPTACALWLQVDIFKASTGLEMGQIIRLRDVTNTVILQRDMRGFHAAIFHKLRTPLTGVSFSLELLSKHNAKLSNDEIARTAETALKSVQRLHDEVEDVLQYAHVSSLIEPDAGLELVQIAELAVRVSVDLGLETVSITGPDRPGNSVLLLSERPLELMFRELLENAKKFHPEQNPTVEIVISQKNEEAVNIEISDDGLTLSPDQLAHAWSPYYQGEKYFTGEAAGMGLGLSTVASLVWGIGGVCRIHNRSKMPGVTVELTLPLTSS